MEVAAGLVAEALPDGIDDSDAVDVCENIDEKTRGLVTVFVKVYVDVTRESFTGKVTVPVVVKIVYVVPWTVLAAAEEVSLEEVAFAMIIESVIFGFH